MIDEMNAKHAKDYAQCTKAETIELIKNGAMVATLVVRGLSDDQLATSATVLTDVAPPMTAKQLMTGGLIHTSTSTSAAAGRRSVTNGLSGWTRR